MINCGETCQNPHRDNLKCDLVTCHSGCFCDSGYLNDELTGECIPTEECKTNFDFKQNQV